jgi:hypothetical protein
VPRAAALRCGWRWRLGCVGGAGLGGAALHAAWLSCRHGSGSCQQPVGLLHYTGGAQELPCAPSVAQVWLEWGCGWLQSAAALVVCSWLVIALQPGTVPTSTGMAYCKHATLDGSSRDASVLHSLAASQHSSCLLPVQLTNGQEHAVALIDRYHRHCWWLLDSECATPVPQRDWAMLRHQLTGSVYILQQLSDIHLILPAALRMPAATDPGGWLDASLRRNNNGSARKKGQPKRSCIQRSEATTEYILTLLGNFQQVTCTLAARAWMMSSAIPTLQSL